jgi:NarL family two-component system response regulator LiaR
MSRKIRVLLAEDGALFIAGLEHLLNHEDDIECIASTNRGEEAIKLATELQPDIILLGVYIQGIDGIEVTRKIKSQFPDIGIIILTRAPSSYVFEAIKAGAGAFLARDSEYTELVQAIRSVHLKDGVFSGQSLNSIRQRFIKGEDKYLHDQLTEREMDILLHVGQLRSSKEIASRLNISERTISMYLNRIFEKLEVRSRLGAVVKALSLGLIKIEDIG